jgi:hypothetical protein
MSWHKRPLRSSMSWHFWVIDVVALIKYPLGYALFAVTHQEVIIPYKSPLTSDYEIEWHEASVAEVTKEYVNIIIPTIRDNIHYVVLKSGIRFQIRRDFVDRNYFNFKEMGVWGRMLLDTPQGFICVLGFRKRKG